MWMICNKPLGDFNLFALSLQVEKNKFYNEKCKCVTVQTLTIKPHGCFLL